MKKLVIGILAHVDAGKTTLSESMLYLCGKIRKLGRVDNQDAYLDTYALEKARGITIFSKQAIFEMEDMCVTLLDTPGHVDFSAEMERTLQVLDYAILVVSGADGVQGHTKTLWRLLQIYQIPTFIFVNKMDQNGTNPISLMEELKKQLHGNCIDFGNIGTESFFEEIAMCDEHLMEMYLENGEVEEDVIIDAIRSQKVLPCFFGSALKLEGVEPFIKALQQYTKMPTYKETFGAKVFKIGRDDQGNRLTYMKITGGTLKVKSLLTGQSTKGIEGINTWEEKVNQIRLYSGQKFEAVSEVDAGTICAVTGLSETRPGEGLGIEQGSIAPILEPVLSYQMILPAGCDPKVMLPKLRQIEEEEPELHIVWDEQLQEIQAQIMGEVQIEILQSLIKERFDVEVTFGSGTILYKETIKNIVEGVGHFEPLRHYAEVHVLIEPGEEGSGVIFKTKCSEDLLEKNWQRLVLTHLQEKPHKGVLTGSAITDVVITLVAGRAHKKHTEGGDFREATYRAVRQGLMEAESILLEPYYAFQLELPEKMVGRAMTDIEKMHGSCEMTQTDGEMALLTGSAPVVTMRNYQKEVIAYTKGHGRLFCSLKGYAPCHNAEEVIDRIGYDPERDIQNPTGSVFCAHGSGFLVDWYQVKEYMHIESVLKSKPVIEDDGMMQEGQVEYEEPWIGLDEIDQILNRTYYSNQGEKSAWKKRKTARESYYEGTTTIRRNEHKVKKQPYLLVDGYNIIYTWEDLNKIAKENMDGARIKLMEQLCNYQGMNKCEVIVVFDAYRVKGHQTEIMDYHNIHVVYTKEAETADQYIEKFSHEHSTTYDITVATSDALEQIIIRGQGCRLLSARELKIQMEHAHQEMMTSYEERQNVEHNYLEEHLSEEARKQFGTRF
ncbi:MAG: TetM/TetW/TetO/TetS family tetracycline resistance ribosomal protection protein [Cellulosilyticum sp.]|nr:TetM/TetW/TetO/TetS family tetracycline resistance ribosomal protection protein [Cellulosilyticum sp.]